VRVQLRVPATSANLGPGFDVLGLALALHNEITVEGSDDVVVSIEGLGAGQLPTDGTNLVVRGVRRVFDTVGRRFEGVTVRCLNRIPPSRGLGSSAAAWVAGLTGGNALLGEPLERSAVLTLAARAEGHPDNVAAAILGGLTVSAWLGERVGAVRLTVPAHLAWVVLVPALETTTRDARVVLPAQVPHVDAVFNLQRASLLIAALAGGDTRLVGPAMEDRLHEPYRLRLFPWLPDVARAAREAGALGCVLSGAGPSVLAVATSAPERIAAAMERALAACGFDGRAHVLAVDQDGVTWRRAG
jgi:homoserine kinase